jgi:hypothetical protein
MVLSTTIKLPDFVYLYFIFIFFDAAYRALFSLFISFIFRWVGLLESANGVWRELRIVICALGIK